MKLHMCYIKEIMDSELKLHVHTCMCYVKKIVDSEATYVIYKRNCG